VITLPKLTPYTGDLVVPSPNRGARKSQAIEGIVLHATADGGDEARSLAWLRSPRSRASCHLLVSRAGRVTRLVGDHQRAWHAGAASWRGKSDVNSVTLGIEIANRNDGEPYTDAQYARVAEIVAHYCRQGLSLDDVVSHGEIATGRRSDPLGWDWNRFRSAVQQQLRQGEGPAQPAFQTRGSRFGRKRVAGIPAVAPRVAAPRTPQPPPIATPKSALRSRTLWLNGATMLASGGVLAWDALDLQTPDLPLPDLQLPVQIILPEDLTIWVLFCVGLVNVVLRFRTTRPLGRSGSAPVLPG